MSDDHGKTTERAVLAGGCFWGVQDLIRKMNGVVSTRVGYSGGDVPNATYRHHGTHADAIEIVFDPARLSYRKLLEFFFQIHDPTTKNRQGNDAGLSYRSAIYFTSDAQKRVAEDTIADVEALRDALTAAPVVTEIVRYADAQHGFHCDVRPAYDAAAAADAWARTLAWSDAPLDPAP